MDYYTKCQAQASKTLKPLLVRMKTAEKQVAVVQDRVAGAKEEIARKTNALTTHRAAAGDRLIASSSAFSEWQGRLRRLQREHDTAQEALDLLERDLGPAASRGLAAAWKEVADALDALRIGAKAPCEARMDDLLAAVIAERDGYLSAWSQVYREFGVQFNRKKGGDPVATSTRLNDVTHFSGGKVFLTFTDKPPVPAEAAASAGAEPEKASGVAEAPQDAPAAT